MEEVDSTQLIQDVEQRYVALRREHDSVMADRNLCKERLVATSTELESLREQFVIAERKLAEFSMESKQKDNLLEQLSTSNEEMQDRLRRRGDECDRLREELKVQSSEMIGLQHRLNDTQIAVTELQTKQMPLQLELTKFQREKEYLEQQVNTLQQELFKRNEEERKYRTESTQKIFQLESKLTECQMELEEKSKEASIFKDQLQIQQDRADSFMKKSQEIETALISQQSSYTSEVEGLKRLTDLYKRHFEEATAKVEELEQSLSSLREVHNNKIQKYKEELKSLVEEKDQRFQEEKKLLKARIIELETKLSALPILSVEELQQAVVEPPKLSNPQDFADFSFTDMYDKVVRLEQDLHQERLRRKEMETYMNQMLKDIETKAPIIAKQRRDYQRIVASHTELTTKLDGVVSENNQLKQVLKDFERRAVQAEHESTLLNSHNRDLARQIQHLLSTSSAGHQSRPVALIEDINSNESEAQNVISNHLVVYNNVEELQQRNEELLRVIRKLTDEKESAMATSAAEKARMEVEEDEEQNQLLQSALVELSDLKEQRTKTEEMLAVLLQQRDMYRAMLEGDLAGSEEAAAVVGASSASAASNFATPLKLLTDRRQSFGSPKGSIFGTPGGDASNNLAKELQLKLDYAEDEKRRIQDRLQRYEEAEKVLHESLDKVRQELTSSKMESAQHHSESRFLKERVERLENALSLSQQESKNTLQRRMELEKSLLEYQKEVRLREDSLNSLRDEMRQLQDTQRRQLIELEVTKQSETRLIQQVNEAREEVKRHANLTDYLHRIEAGLQSRSEEEKETLLREKDALKKSYETLRKQVDDKNAIDEQKAKAIDDELRSLRTKLEVKISEVTSLNESLIKEQAVAKSSQERSALLEKQLSIVQDKLNMLQGNSIVDSLLEKEMAEKEMALQQAKNEIDSLKNQLQSSEVHVDQFRKLSSANEQALKNIRTKFTEFQEKTEMEVKGYEEEIQRLRQESVEHRQSSQKMIEELEASQDAVMKLKQTHQETVNQLTEEKQLLSIEYESVKSQLSTIHLDVEKFQQQAKLAYDNYERELQLHAQAERDLREERSVIDNLKKQCQQLQEQTSQSSMEVMRLTRQISDEKVHVQEEKKRLQDEIDSLTRTNDLLHAQVQSFGLQLEKLHESRLQLHAATATASSASVIAAPTATAGEEGTAAAEGGDGSMAVASEEAPAVAASAGEFDELNELRKSASEMREVLRFMKREKEMLQARLNIAESENNRYVNQLQSLSKSLDEARTELKKELESGQRQLSVANPQDYAKLLQEVQQLHLLRESNSHLRYENEELLKKVSNLTESLEQERAKLIPLEESLRKLQGEKEGLEMVNDQLTNDVGYWKNRLHTLVSRYNDVDPEEHRLLKTKLDESLAKIQDIESQLQKLQSEKTEQGQSLATVQEELKTAQNALEQKGRQLTTSEQSNENLRQKLRQFKTLIESKNEEIAKANAAKDGLKEGIEKELAEAQLKNASLTSQVTDLTARLETANTSLTKVTAALQKANERAASAPVAAAVSAPAAAAAPAETPAVVTTPAAATGEPTPPPPPTTAPPAAAVAAARPVTRAKPGPKPTAAANAAAIAAAPAVAPVAAPVTVTAAEVNAENATPAAAPVAEKAPEPTAPPASQAVPTSVAPAPTPAAPAPTAATPGPAGGDKAAQLKQALMKNSKKRPAAGGATANAAAQPAVVTQAPVPTPAVPAVDETTSSKSSTADVGVEAEGAPSSKKGRAEAAAPTAAVETVAPAEEVIQETPASTTDAATVQPSFIAPNASQMSTGGSDVPALTVTGTPSLEEGEETESVPATKPEVVAPSVASAAAPHPTPAANTPTTSTPFTNRNPFASSGPIATVPASPTAAAAPPTNVFGTNTSSLFSGAGAAKPVGFGTAATTGGIFGAKPITAASPFSFAPKPATDVAAPAAAPVGIVAPKPSVFGGSFGFGGAPATAPSPTPGSLFTAAAAAQPPASGFGSSLFGGGSSIFGNTPASAESTPAPPVTAPPAVNHNDKIAMRLQRFAQQQQPPQPAGPPPKRASEVPQEPLACDEPIPEEGEGEYME